MGADGSCGPIGSGDSRLITSLSAIAARVQRGRTQRDVLQFAGDGIRELGMRFAAFQVEGCEMVLRHVSTAPLRVEAIEWIIGRPLNGLRAPIALCAPAAEILARRENIYREDLDLFGRFLCAAKGIDIAPLDEAPQTAAIHNGIVAPVFVREQPWGLITVASRHFRAADAAAVALFATHVGSALEVADFIEALERTQKELLERERLAALGELAAIVAHEVRNPLGAIFASIASLRRAVGCSGRDANTLLGIVDEEARRLDGIVSDLLDFARPTSLRLRHTVVADIVTDVVNVARTRPESSAVRIDLAVRDDVPSVQLDERLMRQAILNLVINGIQAMPTGGTLTIGARIERREEAAYACFDVSDTGPGIRREDHQRIFEPFFTTKESGTGLGLPLVKRVVDAHEGEVTLVSSGEGTTFTVAVPVQRASPSSVFRVASA